ncbi:Pre-mRNA-splicing factor 18 [Heracleum sosnowskyi]|uniref:Pre-mRNA-splicing factor 18 n=1 Tax=Heracleum sosnowskyi TaxID=360622 RepID=A0AAD8GZ88_9APIA|nr:Pre-mRNA-splicing factor 18 [Heracleum sosnowskyi]
MDIMKEEFRRQRKTLSEQTGGQRIFKRSALEQKKIQQLRLEERREAEQKLIRQNPQIPNSNPNSLSDPAKTRPDSTSIRKEEKTDILNLPKQEVIRRLRFLKQPITLFGEDDEARLSRMKYVLKAGLFEVDDDMTEGQTNDFLRDIVELKKRQKMGANRKRKMSREERSEDNDGGGGDDEEDLKRMRSDFEELCDEDKIVVFFKRLLIEWKQELQAMTDMDKRTAKGKSTVAMFQQCARYLNPLFKFCRKKILQDDIRQALMLMVNCCKKRDYLAAMDHYIRMSIGNAPWPIGVTMVGIHERSAREKIHTSSVAHIMNDETTRKYLQSVKRLMTFCQRRYPTMPSKAVEFNSLANGSDLQSLLAEERGGVGSQPHEERLQLMMAPQLITTK